MDSEVEIQIEWEKEQISSQGFSNEVRTGQKQEDDRESRGIRINERWRSEITLITSGFSYRIYEVNKDELSCIFCHPKRMVYGVQAESNRI